MIILYNFIYITLQNLFVLKIKKGLKGGMAEWSKASDSSYLTYVVSTTSLSFLISLSRRGFKSHFRQKIFY